MNAENYVDLVFELEDWNDLVFVAKAAYAGNSSSDLKKVLAYVKLELVKSNEWSSAVKLMAVAIDGYQLHRASLNAWKDNERDGWTDWSTLIKASDILTVNKWVRRRNPNVIRLIIPIDGSQDYVFRYGTMELSGQASQDDYINYYPLIPKSYDWQWIISIDRVSLENALTQIVKAARVAKHQGDITSIWTYVDKGKIQIMAKLGDTPPMNWYVQIDDNVLEFPKFGLNPKLLLDSVKMWTSPLVDLVMTGSTEPIAFCDGHDRLDLIMPMRFTY